MLDREKVIKGITHHKLGMCDMSGKICPYWNEDDGCSKKMLEDVLSLLKEQGAITPDVDSEGTCTCGNCGENVGWYPVGCKTPVRLGKFCSECGREVKWNDT